MRHSTTRLFAAALFGLLLISFSFSHVACGSTVYVYVHNKDQPSHWIGKWFGSQYAGAAYVDVRDGRLGNIPGGETTRAYCIDYDGPIYIGREYPVTLQPATDTNEWRQIAYIITWYDPPANDTAGVWIQGALWKILDNIIPNFIPSTYNTGINALYDEAANRDVVRGGDKFEWIFPVPGINTHITANPGETVTLKAKITDSVGNARSGVKVTFSVEGGGSLNKVVGWTDSNGVVEIKVTVPNNVVDIKVKASTKGVWPQKYLDLGPDKQDLVGIDTTYQLTVSTNIWILANISVVPELPLGTLAAVVSCFLAFLAKTKRSGL
jgi:hypothetical protein